MSQEDALDVIVVGAGLAGLACAHRAASAGLQVAVLERGDVAGAKNVSGGRLYLEPLGEPCGDLLRDAPFERPVVSESVVLTADDGSVSFRLDRGAAADRPRSVTVLRARLDQHLAERVAAAGALVLCQQRVDSLLRAGGQVIGVKVGSEELHARMVVAADGALSFLAQEANLRRQRLPRCYAVGLKEVIRLAPAAIEARFNLQPGQGASRLYLGQVTRSLPGGGFLYTNQDSLSLGLVVSCAALQRWESEAMLWELLERFKERPEVAPLIAGGATVEYGAHLVPEGGFAELPPLGVPGLLLAGDAAGLVLNTGTMVRGMDLALCSGALAGQSIVEAFAAGLGPAGCLERYRRKLTESFVVAQLRAHRQAPAVLALPRLYTSYPQAVVEGARELFQVDPSGQTRSLRQVCARLRKRVPGWRALHDLWRLARM